MQVLESVFSETSLPGISATDMDRVRDALSFALLSLSRLVISCSFVGFPVGNEFSFQRVHVFLCVCPSRFLTLLRADAKDET